jgi:hypothetical protein
MNAPQSRKLLYHYYRITNYCDHLIRSDEELAHSIDYTLQNPVQTKLRLNWYDWPWSDCSEKIRQLLNQDHPAGGTLALQS